MDLTEVPSSTFRRHPWEIVRAAFFRDALRPVLKAHPTCSVLDVGAGDAFFAATLAAEWPQLRITCFDPGYEERPIAQPVATASAIGFSAVEPDGSYSVVTVLDVVEHVEDDRGLLGHLVAERVCPGGYVLFSVPAWPRLFSDHDRCLRHHRRYTPKAAAALLRDCGLEIVRSGGAFHGPLLARVMVVLKERAARPQDLTGPPPALEWTGGDRSRRIVTAALTADAELSGRAAHAPGSACPA